MLNKIKKFFLYMQALYTGELLKRFEYKTKDIIRYFYFRNNKQKNFSGCNIRCKKLDLNSIDIKDSNEIDKKEYRIFNNTYHYKEFINNLSIEKEFWRKTKLNKYEDVKIIWEYNRLQILLPLAIKYIKTKNDTYKETIKEILQYWEEKNPFEYTMNWNNNLEVAIRAINIGLVLILLQDEQLNEKYSNLLYLHAEHISSEIDYSDSCIPNNHVIGEAVALLFLSKILNISKNKKWYQKSTKLLLKYADVILEDGTSKENSFSYQFFVTKIYILALCFVDEKSIFEYFNKKIIKSLNILRYTRINSKQILNYGDNDGGFLYSIYMDYNIANDIREYTELFLGNKVESETSIYMELLKAYNPSNMLQVEEENNNDYVSTKNIFIYKRKNNLLFFNAKAIEGHAHNDSLAVNLVIDGKEILLDAGTYSYNKDKKQRDYYRSRKAHTTILLDKYNAIPVGTFRWKNKIESFLKEIEETDQYIRVQGIIKEVCKREIIIYKDRNEVEIIDSNLDDRKEIITNWILPIRSSYKDSTISIDKVKIQYDCMKEINQKEVEISKQYLEKEKANCYQISNNNIIKTKIIWE